MEYCDDHKTNTNCICRLKIDVANLSKNHKEDMIGIHKKIEHGFESLETNKVPRWVFIWAIVALSGIGSVLISQNTFAIKDNTREINIIQHELKDDLQQIKQALNITEGR